MGFLDKAKEQASALASKAQEAASQGQAKLDASQAKKHADGLLRDLGAWYYAQRTGRDNGTGGAEIDRIYAELQAHEAEHGPLGGSKDDQGSTAAPTEAVPDVPTPPNPPTPVSPPPAPAPPTAGMTPSLPPPPPAQGAPVPGALSSPAPPPPPAPAGPAPAAPTSPPAGNPALDDL